jgi:hypothetical protein
MTIKHFTWTKKYFQLFPNCKNGMIKFIQIHPRPNPTSNNLGTKIFLILFTHVSTLGWVLFASLCYADKLQRPIFG